MKEVRGAKSKERGRNREGGRRGKEETGKERRRLEKDFLDRRKETVRGGDGRGESKE